MCILLWPPLHLLQVSMVTASFYTLPVQRKTPTASDASKAGLGFSLIFPVFFFFFFLKIAKKVVTFL